MDQQNRFMPGAKTIGDILNENGYIQELMIGSQKEFAGTDKLFLQHGFDKICDINSLKQEYSFKSNELNQWGLDDYKLFELAKNEITQLAQTGKFNFTMATIDCHMPKGFLCKYCLIHMKIDMKIYMHVNQNLLIVLLIGVKVNLGMKIQPLC